LCYKRLLQKVSPCELSISTPESLPVSLLWLVGQVHSGFWKVDRRELAEKETPEERTDSGMKDQAIRTRTVLILLWCPHLEILHLLVILNLASQK